MKGYAEYPFHTAVSPFQKCPRPGFFFGGGGRQGRRHASKAASLNPPRLGDSFSPQTAAGEAICWNWGRMKRRGIERALPSVRVLNEETGTPPPAAAAATTTTTTTTATTATVKLN